MDDLKKGNLGGRGTTLSPHVVDLLRGVSEVEKKRPF